MNKPDSLFGFKILGSEHGNRVDSRVLEERIQMNVRAGHDRIEVIADGQHGIGGRLVNDGPKPFHILIKGRPGQRTGSLGYFNTIVEIIGDVSDDVGWLNAGAEIIVHGNAGNGAANGMAQGKIYISGNIGARGMTMTKHNPRFEPPELWVLGSAGDYFAEFMAGGIAVICGIDPHDSENILGYRPCVGMVGGKIFFRGPHLGFSQADAIQVPISDEEWDWLLRNIKIYLNTIDRHDLTEDLTDKNAWQLIRARTPHEKYIRKKRSMTSFRKNVWNKNLGQGGLLGDLISTDTHPIPLIVTGHLRRFMPVWENQKFTPPCEANCPTGMPVHERWRLIREGRVDEAVDLALRFTPFPASVCGFLCPNLCMAGCSRSEQNMPPVDITKLGKESIRAELPKLPPLTGKRAAIIGGGPAGISVAWQLRLKGHEPVIYDRSKSLGGKMASAIPNSRLPEDILKTEIQKVASVLSHIHLQQDLSQKDIEQLRNDYDAIVIAAGAQTPRTLPIPGIERAITALDFLKQCKTNSITVGKNVVIIGAGNVGCDAATEAHRLGAEQITLIDIQEPLSFGKEREAAEQIGAQFRWPCYTKEITDQGVMINDNELIPAETIIISIGDKPDISFLPETVQSDNGFISVNDSFQTTDDQIYAIGDIVKPGLLTDAIGAGRIASDAIHAHFSKQSYARPLINPLDYSKPHLAYYDPRITHFDSIEQCGTECASCGTCKDCGICVAVCPQGAISRQAISDSFGFKMISDPNRCIGCGFCENACPCGVWQLIPNQN